MTERARFIGAYCTGFYTMSELCHHFDISRPTGYKWVRRFEAEGFSGLKERSRAPKTSPQRTPPSVRALIIATRKAHPHWGPVTIVDYLRARHAHMSLPAPSTAGSILKQAGLLVSKKRKRRRTHPGSGHLHTSAPNQVWTADFKGEFRLLNGRYCYPLTIVDAHSRYLLSCTALPATRLLETRTVFDAVFDTYGIPLAIRTDNGVPFASQGICGLAQLNVWWLQLGIVHQRIRRGRPQENARHERMHRTLKQATTLPAEADMNAQQSRFDAFVKEYNTIRPHRALNGQTPASHYVPSQRRLPATLPQPDYAAHFEVRRVSRQGCIKFKNTAVFLSSALSHNYVGLEEIADGLWSIYFFDKLLARYNQYDRSLI